MCSGHTGPDNGSSRRRTAVLVKGIQQALEHGLVNVGVDVLELEGELEAV